MNCRLHGTVGEKKEEEKDKKEEDS